MWREGQILVLDPGQVSVYIHRPFPKMVDSEVCSGNPGWVTCYSPRYVIVQCVPLSLLATAQDEWTALRRDQPNEWVQLREDITAPGSNADVAECLFAPSSGRNPGVGLALPCSPLPRD